MAVEANARHRFVEQSSRRLRGADAAALGDRWGYMVAFGVFVGLGVEQEGPAHLSAGDARKEESPGSDHAAARRDESAVCLRVSEKQPMRIVILISVFERGGAERQAFLLARELRQRHGLDVEVWALLYPGAYEDEFKAAGIPTNVIGFRWPRSKTKLLRQLPRVISHLRRGRIDVLMPFTTWPNVIAGLSYKLAGIKHCIWGERHAGGERVPGFERLAASQYDHFVANSTAGVEFLLGEMRIARHSIFHVPNGVELPTYTCETDWRERLALYPKQLLVTKVANLTAFKDHETLLRAWRMVQDAWEGDSRPTLALAGYHGDRSETLRCFAQQAEILETVHFLGSVKELPSLLHASDLTVFSSKREGMPNGVLECMAAGKAVIATDLPGVRDALGDAALKSVVPPGDPNQLASRLLDFLRNPSERELQGAANRERILQEFSVERMARLHLQVIGARSRNMRIID